MITNKATLPKDLRDLRDNPKYSGIFKYFADRKRDSKDSSTVESIRNAISKGYVPGISVGDVKELFRKFEALGLGKLTRNDYNQYSIFTWAYPLKDILLAAGNAGPLCGTDVVDPDENYVPPEKIEGNHDLYLRKRIKLSVPKDISQSEIDYIKNWLDNIPTRETCNA